MRLLYIRTFTSCSKKNSIAVANAVAKSNSVIKPINNLINVSDNSMDVFDDEKGDYEEMYVNTSFNNIEWGGPLRGGGLPEPTRFGDWERKGRCSDY